MVPGVLSSRFSWRHVMMRRLLVGVSVMFALIALACVTANAQAAYGNIIGTVTDSSGAAVPNAQVTVTDLGKGVTRTATTNASGYYSVNNLTPGSYKVSVTAEKFKTFVQQSMPVIVGTSTTLNPRLQVGAVSEEVT